ncbi:MAG: DUF6527 family protein [Solirubrobacteraceae bacterium]
MEFVPESLEPNTLYISMEYGTVVHACLCGCGERVVTPLTPVDWHLTFDGETVSLSRSVGNWSFPCQSHYWIERSRVHWAGAWSKAKIRANRASDLDVKGRFYDDTRRERPLEEPDDPEVDGPGETRTDWRRRLRSWLPGR